MVMYLAFYINLAIMLSVLNVKFLTVKYKNIEVYNSLYKVWEGVEFNSKEGYAVVHCELS